VNNATLASATEIAISDEDCYQDVEALLDLIHSGTIIISSALDPQTYQVFQITGFTAEAGFTRLSILHVFTGGSYVPVNDENCKLVFYPQVLGTVFDIKSFTFNYQRVTGTGKPTQVSQGVFNGWSLPVYSADDEELFACDCMPASWDGETDPKILIGGWLDTANNAKKFQLQVSVETISMTGNAVVPVTTNDYPIETTTGNWAQYTSFIAEITIAAATIGLLKGQPIAIRIRRIAASTAEIAGEVVVEGASLRWAIDKVGPLT